MKKGKTVMSGWGFGGVWGQACLQRTDQGVDVHVSPLDPIFIVSSLSPFHWFKNGSQTLEKE